MPSNKKDTTKDDSLRDRFFDVLYGLASLPRRACERVRAAWVYVCLYASSLVRKARRTYRTWISEMNWRREAEQRRQEAYDTLLDVMGTYDYGHKSSDAEEEPVEDREKEARENAGGKVAAAAHEMAELAPTGSLSPEKAAELIEAGQALEDVEGMGIYAMEDPFKMSDTSEDSPGTRTRADSVLREFTNPMQDRQQGDSVVERFSSKESHLADASGMSDEIVPPPYRSEIKHTDLQVRGFWETNPNAQDTVQEASRFPLVDRQITKTVEHLTTSGVKITGPPEQAAVIRKWFEVDLEYSTGYQKGLNRYVEDLAGQMLRYGSGVVFKQRSRSKLMDPFEDPLTGANRSPVHGYAIPDMATVEAFIDKYGRPRKWRQKRPLWSGRSDAKEYKDRDVFVARLPTRNSAMYFWTPSLVMPVLYAVEVLKDLHETIESHTKNIVDIPSYAKVGSDKYIDGKVTPSMLQKVAQTIRKTARGLMLIMPWYVDLEKHESDEYIEELISSADFWEKIVRRGVGGNQFDDGDGGTSNRRTADVLQESDMRLAQAMVPEIQRSLRWLFIDKLLENDFTMDEITSHDEMVGVTFEDIDLSSQMAREGHTVFKWQNDGMTHGEYRTELGYDVDEDRADMYYSDIKAEVEGEITEAESRSRPNGNPKPKRKQDMMDLFSDDLSDEQKELLVDLYHPGLRSEAIV